MALIGRLGEEAVALGSSHLAASVWGLFLEKGILPGILARLWGLEAALCPSHHPPLRFEEHYRSARHLGCFH